jgi:hypothetical protein
MLWWILKIIFRKDVDIMATVYATLIIKGLRTFESVPDLLKDKVKEILVALEMEDLAK